MKKKRKKNNSDTNNVAENKNLHITHIKRNLAKHRLYIKVAKNSNSY